VQRLEYYPDRQAAGDLLPVTHQAVDGHLVTDAIVVNVRAAEIVDDVHEDYGPVPVDFLVQAVELSGLEPVLVGQLGDNSYSNEIRGRFAGCRIIESVSPVSDFELIRSARQVVHGVSTFSWLAAWLSPRAEQVFLPVSGIFNPRQRPDIDLLPISDERYRFFELPTEPWTAHPEQMARLVSSGNAYNELTTADLRSRRLAAHEALQQFSEELDISALTSARRQRDRLRRRLASVTEANQRLRGQT